MEKKVLMENPVDGGDGEVGHLEPENNNGYFGELEIIVDGENEGEKEILPNFDGEYYAQ